MSLNALWLSELWAAELYHTYVLWGIREGGSKGILGINPFLLRRGFAFLKQCPWWVCLRESWLFSPDTVTCRIYFVLLCWWRGKVALLAKAELQLSIRSLGTCALNGLSQTASISRALMPMPLSVLKSPSALCPSALSHWLDELLDSLMYLSWKRTFLSALRNNSELLYLHWYSVTEFKMGVASGLK